MSGMDAGRFEKATNLIGGLTDERLSQFQRTFYRIRTRGPVELIPVGEGAEGDSPHRYGAELYDISRNGMSVILNDLIPLDTCYWVRLLTSGIQISSVTLYPRFCRELETGLYYLGGVFGLDTRLLVAAGVDPREAQEGDWREIVPESSDADTGSIDEY